MPVFEHCCLQQRGTLGVSWQRRHGMEVKSLKMGRGHLGSLLGHWFGSCCIRPGRKHQETRRYHSNHCRVPHTRHPRGGKAGSLPGPPAASRPSPLPVSHRSSDSSTNPFCITWMWPLLAYKDLQVSSVFYGNPKPLSGALGKDLRESSKMAHKLTRSRRQAACGNESTGPLHRTAGNFENAGGPV